MQVIRLSLNKKRTYWQKLKELISALRLELSYSKDEILAIYAANAPFGSNVVGLEAASWRYFNRKPDQLSWAEVAMLAVLPNSPSLVHPGRNRTKLLQKRNFLIDQLRQENVIDSSTAELAKLEAIPEKPIPLPQEAPHLLDRFKQDFNKIGVEKTILRTTVDIDLQRNISQLLKRHHNQFKANGINNVAALVLDVETGNTLAYVGNVYEPSDPELESHVDMIKALRSPGSTLKPLLYAAMLTDGSILPNTLIQDIPTQIGSYTPQNYDLGYDGAIPASKALSRSLNIPAVKMLQQYKYQRFHQVLRKLGINSLNNQSDYYGLSMILGGCETSMWELSGVYASMARTFNHYRDHPKQYDPADYHPPQYFNSEKKDQRNLETSSIIDYGSLFYTFLAMQEVMRPGEELLWEQFSSSKRISWKTGTSFGFRDGWAIGITPERVVCIWVGNADGEGRPELTGINTAAPILFDVFDLLEGNNEFQPPYKDMVRLNVCKTSGYKAGSYCSNTAITYLPSAGSKSSLCPFHQLVHLNKTETFRVTSACESPENMVHASWFVLPPAMEYYYKIRNKDYKILPPFSPECAGEQENYKAMELIYPKNNAKIYIPLEIDGKKGQAIFNAAHRDQNSKIYWSVDGNFITTTTSFHQIAISPGKGIHTITLIDDKGNRLVQVFEVLDK
jgi:penicillin-binding protein 1C